MFVGVDFGAPRRARDQRRKIVAIAARAAGPKRYVVDAAGMNARLVAGGLPGWSARELVETLRAHPMRVVAFDFPFSVPASLLTDAAFAAAAGHSRGAFGSWETFRAFVAERLPLHDELDFSPFIAWRDPERRASLWLKRATDVAAGAQPPLKDKFQATFQMTLLGNAMLERLCGAHLYRAPPLGEGHGAHEVIEVYPGATLRHAGLSSYKARPHDALAAAMALCTAVGITLDVDPRLLAFCRSYSSGSGAPDHDAADAFVALCTALLYAEGACRPALVDEHAEVRQTEGAIWVPKGTRPKAG